MKIFSPREQKILDELIFIFKDATAQEMSEISHLKKQPWDLTYRTKGENKPIDYELAIDCDVENKTAEIEQSIQEHFEIIKNFELFPTA